MKSWLFEKINKIEKSLETCQEKKKTKIRNEIGGNMINTTETEWIISSVQSCLILCNLIDCSTTGLPVHHQLPELTQTDVH